MADWLGKTVSVLKRDQTNNELTIQTVVRIGHMVDNLKYDDINNKLYTGTINSMFSILFLYPASGSQVAFNTGGVTEMAIPKVNGQASQSDWLIRDLIVTNKLNAISNGLRMGNQLLLSSLSYDGYLICPFDDDIVP